MRRVILIMALAMFSGTAMADWTKVAAGSKTLTAYADLSTLSKNGNKVKMWVLFDYKTAQTVNGGMYLSSKSQIEYHCEKNITQLLDFSWHTGKMGGGDAIRPISYQTQPNFPGSVDDALWKLACKNR